MQATLEVVLEAARHLTPTEQAVLVHCLEAEPAATPDLAELDHITEWDTLAAAGAFSGDDCLALAQAVSAHFATDEELLNAIEDISSEWEGELEEMFARDGLRES